MIEKAIGYKVGETVYASLREAQIAELKALLIDTASENVPAMLVSNATKVVDILTTGPKSRPKSRTANGATRKSSKRTPAPVATATAQPDASAKL